MATAASAAGGTALAVLFGTVFANGFAASAATTALVQTANTGPAPAAQPAAPATPAAPAQPARVAKLPAAAHPTTHAATAPKPKPKVVTPKPAAPKPALAPPPAAPQAANTGGGSDASSGAS